MKQSSIYRITTFDYPKHKMDTQYGLVFYNEWLKLEKKRIEEKSGLKCEIILNNKEDRVALAYIACNAARLFLLKCREDAEMYGVSLLDPRNR